MKNILLSLTSLILLAVQAQAAITGQQYCNRYMCITAQHDSDKSIDTYTLAPPSGTNIPQSQFGWIAIGFGTTMISTPMVIVWPNSDGSITLSQRKTNNHVTPTVDSNPPRKATLLSSSSFSNSSTTSISFTLPSVSNTNLTNLIWAYGNKNPGSSSSSSSFTQHLASGNTQISLLANSLPSPVSSTPTSNGNSTSSTNRPNSPIAPGSGSGSGAGFRGSSKKILIAHVVCGAIATMAILPIGILVPRIARGFSMNRWWFPVHSALNGLIAFGLITAAFAIARANFMGGFNSTHRKLGLTLFILALIQTLLGLLTHFWQPNHRFQTKSGRGPINFLHMILGIVVVGVGFGTVWWGIDEEWERYSGSGRPNVGWKAGWGLIVGITALAYLGGFYLLPRQLRMEKERRQWASNVSSSRNNNTTTTTSSKFRNNDNSTFVPPPPPTHHSHHHHHTHGTGITQIHDNPPPVPGTTRIITNPNYVLPPPPKRRLPPAL